MPDAESNVVCYHTLQTRSSTAAAFLTRCCSSASTTAIKQFHQSAIRLDMFVYLCPFGHFHTVLHLCTDFTCAARNTNKPICQGVWSINIPWSPAPTQETLCNHYIMFLSSLSDLHPAPAPATITIETGAAVTVQCTPEIYPSLIRSTTTLRSQIFLYLHCIFSIKNN